MKKILILGAGRSASSLINYLIAQAKLYHWSIVVADMSLELAAAKIGENTEIAQAVEFVADDHFLREKLIKQADAVISMLPATLHTLVATDCLTFGKNLFNASYVSPDIKLMEQQIIEKKLLFICELGLDPGIDHMSAMQIINELHAQNAEIIAFRSYTGGLVAPAHDDNLWHYKFSWNPRNVVVAGQSTAKYLHNHQLKIVNYQRLFAEAEAVTIPNTVGEYEIYPNRDSLSYLKLYDLEHIPTLLRATIRYKGYAAAWNVLLQLGLTDDSYTIAYSETTTYREWFLQFLPAQNWNTDEQIIAYLCQQYHFEMGSDTANKIISLQLWNSELVGLQQASPALILQQRLEKLWVLQPSETDMVIMQHEFIYKKAGKTYLKLSTLVQEGKNATETAMANLVGLPLAIAVKLFLLGEFKLIGLHIPILETIYKPILAELQSLGTEFKEQITEL